MSGPPDPSLPDQRQQDIRQQIMQVLADPMQWPDETTNWLLALVALAHEGKTVTIPPGLTSSFTFTV